MKNKTLSIIMICCSTFYQNFPSEPSSVKRTYDQEKTAELKKTLELENLGQACVLVAAHADPNFQAKWGESTIQRAAFKNHFELCKTCLENGSSANDQERHLKWTPLMRTSSSDIVKLLLRNKADVQKENVEKRTALHFHAFNSNQTGETISLLCNAGCNPDIQDINGDTPLHRVCEDPVAFFPMKAAALMLAECNRTLKNWCNKTAREELQRTHPTQVANFDSIIVATSKVKEIQKTVIELHLPPIFTPIVIAYAGWDPQLETDITEAMKPSRKLLPKVAKII